MIWMLGIGLLTGAFLAFLIPRIVRPHHVIAIHRALNHAAERRLSKDEPFLRLAQTKQKAWARLKKSRRKKRSRRDA
jgi:hypothetical protein